MTNQSKGDGLFADKQREVFNARQRGRTILGEFFGNGEAPRGFGSSFGNILKFAFELKNMVCHIFWPKARRSKAGPTERVRRARARIAVEDLNGGYRREALGGSRLSRRRYSCAGGRRWVRCGIWRKPDTLKE